MAFQHVTKRLRERQTPWEILLWKEIRNRRLENLKFRRQYKIGNYVVDFCCLEKKLIVEIDGGHHNLDENKRADLKRERYLENLGYKVLRFWNNDIDVNIDGVVAEILKYV